MKANNFIAKTFINTNDIEEVLTELFDFLEIDKE